MINCQKYKWIEKCYKLKVDANDIIHFDTQIQNKKGFKK